MLIWAGAPARGAPVFPESVQFVSFVYDFRELAPLTGPDEALLCGLRANQLLRCGTGACVAPGHLWRLLFQSAPTGRG